ncbi:MAG TPA: nuclear transport factor 2 family protein [Candidatus Binataceae bacterium]
MDEDHQSIDEQTVRKLDQSWNQVYLRNDRSAFAEILADDFCVTLADGRTGGKVDMMKPTPEGAKVSFSEPGVQIFSPTAVTRGRVRIEHPDRVVDQRYVRVYSKRAKGWQAVCVFVFPVGEEV